MRDLVYVAYGWQGEDFTVHHSEEGARDAVIKEAIALGIVANETEYDYIKASPADLDGFYVESYVVFP